MGHANLIFVGEVNSERRVRGLPDVYSHDDLSKGAQGHANYVARCGRVVPSEPKYTENIAEVVVRVNSRTPLQDKVRPSIDVVVNGVEDEKEQELAFNDAFRRKGLYGSYSHVGVGFAYTNNNLYLVMRFI
ncbi:MAG: CAP domain-containing protein [Candidatus Woesearchaeota archaeon]